MQGSFLPVLLRISLERILSPSSIEGKLVYAFSQFGKKAEYYTRGSPCCNVTSWRSALKSSRASTMSSICPFYTWISSLDDIVTGASSALSKGAEMDKSKRNSGERPYSREYRSWRVFKYGIRCMSSYETLSRFDFLFSSVYTWTVWSSEDSTLPFCEVPPLTHFL